MGLIEHQKALVTSRDLHQNHLTENSLQLAHRFRNPSANPAIIKAHPHPLLIRPETRPAPALSLAQRRKEPTEEAGFEFAQSAAYEGTTEAGEGGGARRDLI